jgi:Uncharacterized protein conserved in bacteria
MMFTDKHVYLKQARQFLLIKHGLLGKHKFSGKQGVLDFVRQAGCIQYDPVDVCGRNAELVLQSRVKGFTKAMLNDLLYKDRQLVDYPDKNTSIILSEDLAYFDRERQYAQKRASEHPELIALMDQVHTFIKSNGVVCSDDLKLESDFKWRAYIVWSSGKNLFGSVLEQLYGIGDLVIHHKNGTRKYYDLAENHIPSEILNAPNPLPDDNEYKKWRTLRRIGAIGLLWNRPSDAWLCIYDMKTAERNKIFSELIDEGKIIAVNVENINDTLYCLAEDEPLIEYVLSNPKLKPRTEFIAPLDNMMWDRKLIDKLFGFNYKWEIYTPAADLKYGHYVLPILHGDKFVGRIEAVNNRKESILEVKNVWLDTDCDITDTIQRFAEFNNCNNIKYTN